MSLRKVTMGIAAVTGLGAAAWLLAPVAFHSSVSATRSTATAGQNAVTTGPGDRSEVTAAATKRPVLSGRYEVSHTIHFESPQASPEGGLGRATADASLTAILEAVAPLAREDQEWLAVRLVDVKLSANDAALKMMGLQTAEMQRALAEPFLLHLDAEGRLDKPYFARSTDDTARGVLTTMLVSAQFVRPSESAKTWQTEERDLNHSFHATYAPTSDGRVGKRWLVDGTSPDVIAKGEVDAGFKESLEAEFAVADGPLVEVHTHQTFAASLGDVGGTPMVATGAYDLRLKRLGPAQTAFAKALSPTALALYAPQDEPRTLQEAASNRDAVTILDEVGAAGVAEDPVHYHTLVSELGSVVKVNDALAKTLTAQVRTETNEPKRRAILTAFAEAGTPAAQAGLAELASDQTVEEVVRRQVLGASVWLTEPTEAFATAMTTLAYAEQNTQYGSVASLVIGAHIKHQDAEKPSNAARTQAFVQQATGRLVPNLPTVSVPGVPPIHVVVKIPPVEGETRWNWIAALGNAALPETTPLVLTLLQHDPDEFSRAAAAMSTRFLPVGQVVPVLEKQMAQEDSIHVRSAIINACNYLGPAATKELVHKTLRFDHSETVRLTAAFVIASWAQMAPGLNDLLKEALESERKPGVAEALRNYLEPGRAAAPFQLLPNEPIKEAP